MVDFTTNPVVTFTKETYVLRSNFTQQTATSSCEKSEMHAPEGRV